MIPQHYISVLLVAIWLVMACLLPILRRQHRMPAFWLLVLTGVPVLGWLTLHWGPGAGFGTLVLALGTLLRSPLDPLRRRRGNIGGGLH